MSRLAGAFSRIAADRTSTGRGGLITYVTAGDPDAATSAEILVALADAGADVLEVGVPFSDPVADGPVIQRASERALHAGMTLRRTLDLIRSIRPMIRAPIVLFTYANPVLRMDREAFMAAASDAGVDGLLILDLPLEEAEALRDRQVEAGIDPIYLISPTTSEARIRRTAQLGAGFLYVISRLGVTGARDEMASAGETLVARVRRNASLPVALGFGISSPQQVSAAWRFADAAVVGSGLVSMIAEHRPQAAARAAGDYVRWLIGRA